MALSPEKQAEFDAWMKTRPQSIQDFQKKHGYLPGDTFTHEGRTWYIIGFGEDANDEVGLIVSPYNPNIDYDKAFGARQHICPKHF